MHESSWALASTSWGLTFRGLPTGEGGEGGEGAELLSARSDASSVASLASSAQTGHSKRSPPPLPGGCPLHTAHDPLAFLLAQKIHYAALEPSGPDYFPAGYLEGSDSENSRTHYRSVNNEQMESPFQMRTSHVCVGTENQSVQGVCQHVWPQHAPLHLGGTTLRHTILSGLRQAPSPRTSHPHPCTASSSLHCFLDRLPAAHCCFRSRRWGILSKGEGKRRFEPPPFPPPFRLMRLDSAVFPFPPLEGHEGDGNARTSLWQRITKTSRMSLNFGRDELQEPVKRGAEVRNLAP